MRLRQMEVAVLSIEDGGDQGDVAERVFQFRMRLWVWSVVLGRILLHLAAEGCRARTGW